MSLETYFNKTCTIQTKTETQSASGQKVESWANTLLLVKCRIDAWGGQEQIAPSMVYEKATHILFLRNQSVTLDVGTHRIILDSITYNILLVKRMYETTDLSHLEVLLEIVK
jgi:head-tail adaptor